MDVRSRNGFREFGWKPATDGFRCICCISSDSSIWTDHRPMDRSVESAKKYVLRNLIWVLMSYFFSRSAALLTLLCTKTSVILTTAILAAMLHFGNLLSSVGNGELITALSIFCIATNMISVLGTTAIQVIITKDWVVVICHPDENFLTGSTGFLGLAFLELGPHFSNEYDFATNQADFCLYFAIYGWRTYGLD